MIDELNVMLANKMKKRGSYECFHCMCNSVHWDADFSYEDYGLEGEGIVNVCHCDECGAEILYFVPCIKDEEYN